MIREGVSECLGFELHPYGSSVHAVRDNEVWVRITWRVTAGMGVTVRRVWRRIITQQIKVLEDWSRLPSHGVVE
jgi:hypothetical protein